MRKRVPLNSSGHFPQAPAEFDLDVAFAWLAAEYQRRMWRGGHFVVHGLTAVDNHDVEALFEDEVKIFVLKAALRLDAFKSER